MMRDGDGTGRQLTEIRAANALLTVVSRAAVVLVAGVLVWGFNKIDRSLEEVSATLGQVQVSIGRLETERDSIKERLDTLSWRLGQTERFLFQADRR